MGIEVANSLLIVTILCILGPTCVEEIGDTYRGIELKMSVAAAIAPCYRRRFESQAHHLGFLKFVLLKL